MPSADFKWTVAMVTPGEEELALLSQLTQRQDTLILGLVDPRGASLGAGLAELLGLRVYPDLDSLPRHSGVYLVHPPVDEEVAAIADGALELGLVPISAQNFSNLLVDKALTDTPAERPLSLALNFDFLESETAAIHETLGRIEEALDRESLLRWLLKLATKATAASNGSIMLFDDATQELYLAFGQGLSQSTLHRTRVRLGEGIAGRVAKTGKSELIRGLIRPLENRDRGEIQSGVCSPLSWQGKLLGVLNLSTLAGESDFNPDALSVIDNLTHRFGLILDRFLRLQGIRDAEVFRKLETELQEADLFPDSVEKTLCRWVSNVAENSGADQASLGIVTADGSLLQADPEKLQYETAFQEEKETVLASGAPLVLRPSGEHSTTGESVHTVYYLPIGQRKTRAVLELVFNNASGAHHFHSLSGEIVYRFNRRLAGFLERAATNDQLDRMTTLATTLTELSAAAAGDPNLLAQRAVSAACLLTGARQACLLTDERNPGHCTRTPLSPEMRAEANRLLRETEARGWNSTTLEGALANAPDQQGQSLMVVPRGPGKPFPGLVLIGKKRMHPLDGACFTSTDASFAQRLLPVLDSLTPSPAEPLADKPQARPSTVLTAVRSKALSEVRPPDIIKSLEVEIDRCKRYHTMVGVLALRLSGDRQTRDQLDKLSRSLAAKLRTSDQVGCLSDGTLVVLVPEDIQSLPLLQKRIEGLLRQGEGPSDLVVQTASRVFPGTGKTAPELMESLLNSLH